MQRMLRPRAGKPGTATNCFREIRTDIYFARLDDSVLGVCRCPLNLVWSKVGLDGKVDAGMVCRNSQSLPSLEETLLHNLKLEQYCKSP